MMDIHLVKTCEACPEQYDAFDGDRQVGYLRLRHGHFTVECPDSGGVMVFHAQTEGDGVFNIHERKGLLSRAKTAIEVHYQNLEPEAGLPEAGL